MNETSVFIIKGKKAKQVEDFIKTIDSPFKDTSLYKFKSPNKKTNCYVSKDFAFAIDSFLNTNNNFFYRDIKNHLKKTFSKVDNVSLSGYLNHRNFYKRKYYNNELNSVLTVWSRLD